MNKELCFHIENENLYLEQVLVDYMNIPIFFLCKGEYQYFIILCIDVDELNYIVTKVSLRDIYNLLHGKIPMRDIILKQKEYWEVLSGEEIALDTVIQHSINELETSLLPEENAYFEILTREMEVFVQKFDNEFLAAKYFYESEKKADLDGIFENKIVDILVANVEQFTNLGNCKVKKTVSSHIVLYDETMNNIKNAEVVFKNCNELNQQMDDAFKLVKSVTYSIAAA